MILCRDKRNVVHVFLNSCRHRGMKVCRYEQGNTSLFTCPYHSWSYTTDGRLQGVPLYKALYDGVLDRSQMSLIEVAKLANYKGTIWATWDPAAPDFETYLGDARLHLDMALDCRDGRRGRVGGHRRAQVDLPGELEVRRRELPGRHLPQPEPPLRGPDRHRPQRPRPGRRAAATTRWTRRSTSGSATRRATACTAPSCRKSNEYIPSFQNDPKIEEYFRHCFEERKRRLGHEASRLIPFIGTIFPNTSYHGRQPRGLCAWHPHSPTETEAWRFFLVDADAPAEVKEFLRHYYMRYSGPAGMTEQDDMENWLYATRASTGTIARRYPFNYQQSLHASTLDGPVPGKVSTQMTEEMPRGYYRRWASYMRGAGWDELLGTTDPAPVAAPAAAAAAQ